MWPDLTETAAQDATITESYSNFGLVGRGVRLFDGGEVDLRCVETIEGEGAVHLRYEVQ